MLKNCSPRLRLCAPLLLLCLALTGCKQDEGDRCQLDSDCSDGLICCFAVNPPPLEQRYLGGTCTTPEQCSTTQPDPDLGENADAAGESVATDSTVDSPGADGNDVNDSTVDSASEDSTVDSTPPADSTVDSTDDIQ